MAHLRHLITLSLPAESLVVKRIVIGPDKNRLPVYEATGPLTDVEHVHILRLDRFLPLLALRHVVAAGAQFLMEGYSGARLQHLHLCARVGPHGR